MCGLNQTTKSTFMDREITEEELLREVDDSDIEYDMLDERELIPFLRKDMT